MTTYLSGIQPSGLLHFGNYFGAMRQHLDLQGEDGEHFYFIADYHALTTVKDPEVMRQNVEEVALGYLALGLDPERVSFFRQSDVPEVCELTWILACATGMGVLERAVSYKDKVAQGIKPSVGLFTYPVLMASDILVYDSNVVPVGHDQKQHVEIAQDIVRHFNTRYGEVLVRPEPRVSSDERLSKVVGVDGRKMSKSYGNAIWIFESGKPLKKAVGRIVTDSRAPEEPKDPQGILLMSYLELFLGEPELGEWKERIVRGGEGAPGYGHLKVRLVEAIDEHFAAARARREELLADRGEVERILARGAERARERAAQVLERTRAACGLR
jgi:tryptophanyl-tRNA synthetase